MYWSQPGELHQQDSRKSVKIEIKIKTVDQYSKEEALALRGMLILMGFPQDAAIIEENYQACVCTLPRYHTWQRKCAWKKFSFNNHTLDLGTKILALPLFCQSITRIIDNTLRMNLKEFRIH